MQLDRKGNRTLALQTIVYRQFVDVTIHSLSSILTAGGVHPHVTVSDHFQIAPQDRDVPAVIRVTFTVYVTAVNCTVTLKYIFALTSRNEQSYYYYYYYYYYYCLQHKR